MPKKKACLVFAGRSNVDLARKIAKTPGIRLGKIEIETFPDGEVGARILESVHGEDVFALQTIARCPNLYLMELLIMVDALKRAGARTVTAVVPYFGYSRQDRRACAGDPISAKLVAHLLEAAGVSKVITIDLHSPQMEGFFTVPLVHLSGDDLLAEAIKKEGWKKSVIVGPDLGSVWRARAIGERLGAVDGFIDKRRMSAKRVEGHTLIGDVKGQNVVLVDDLCSTGQTLVSAASVCRRSGSKKIFAAVTHVPFSKEGLNSDFEACAIEKMVVTDTVPLPSTGMLKKVKVISVAPLFARAILQSFQSI